jgi:hypothetical protein
MNNKAHGDNRSESAARVDVVVVGAGAAGIAAAIASARTGRATLLVDRRAEAGGTGGFSGLTTLCGLFDDEGRYINEGFAHEFARAVGEADPVRMGRVWVMPYRPQRFREVARNWMGGLPTLRCLWETEIAEVVVNGQRITKLNGVDVGSVVDCSGTAVIARAIGAPCLATDEKTQAPAVVFTLGNVSRPMDTLEAAAQVLLPLARAGLPPVNFQPGPEPQTLTVKFSGGTERAGELIEFLQKHVSGFEHCLCPQTEFVASERAGRMIRGQYLLTGADVLEGRKFPDAAVRCAWPIEQWDARGKVSFRYLPAKLHYEIPLRALRCAGIENLFMAGKTISADVDAIASARVMGCCLATGEAAGRLAAESAAARR